MKRNIDYIFSGWQNEIIFSSKYGYMKRLTAIRMFIKEGIIPFILKNGYIFSNNVEYIEDTIASMIFYYNLNKFNSYFDFDLNNKYDKHYDHYSYIITTDMWNNFFKYWSNTFDDNFLLYNESSLTAEIILLVWQLLNLSKSHAYIKYIEEESEDLNENEYTKKMKSIDPYILDQINRNTHHKFSKFEL